MLDQVPNENSFAIIRVLNPIVTSSSKTIAPTTFLSSTDDTTYNSTYDSSIISETNVNITSHNDESNKPFDPFSKEYIVFTSLIIASVIVVLVIVVLIGIYCNTTDNTGIKVEDKRKSTRAESLAVTTNSNRGSITYNNPNRVGTFVNTAYKNNNKPVVKKTKPNDNESSDSSTDSNKDKAKDNTNENIAVDKNANNPEINVNIGNPPNVPDESLILTIEEVHNVSHGFVLNMVPLLKEDSSDLSDEQVV